MTSLIALALAASTPATAEASQRIALRLEPGPLSGLVRVVAPVWGAAPRGVSFYVDGVRRARDTSRPFVLSWRTRSYANGRHRVVARIRGRSKEAIAGRFVWNSSTLSPGTPLPTGADCAARVTPSSWEPRPENYEANHTVPPTPVFAEIDGGDPIAQSRFLPRIDGNFTGTTDEIIRWASCKWGFDPAITRARVWAESSWRQSTVGDAGESFGLLQVKRTVHGGYPWTEDATALNLEYALAWLRSCYEGWMSHWLPPGARGDEWGCIGLWFSGEWKTNNRDYIVGVRRELVARPWLALR